VFSKIYLLLKLNHLLTDVWGLEVSGF